MDAFGVILGSAFSQPPQSLALDMVEVDTPFGPWELYRIDLGTGRRAVASFRHAYPHRFLPNHIAYRAQAVAMSRVGVTNLLVTGSVVVLDESLPMQKPLLVSDVIMLDNRLPDGSACTVFPEPKSQHGHLVADSGLTSSALADQLRERGIVGDVVVGYAPGPRSCTPAERHAWAGLGAQALSMTIAPELVLAAELEMACAAVVIGDDHTDAKATRAAFEDIVEWFAGSADAAPANATMRRIS